MTYEQAFEAAMGGAKVRRPVWDHRIPPQFVPGMWAEIGPMCPDTGFQYVLLMRTPGKDYPTDWWEHEHSCGDHLADDKAATDWEVMA